MKRIHYAILTGEALSYTLIIVFVFADAFFDLTGVLRSDRLVLSPQFAYVAGCLIGVVGCINVWLTWYYIQKADRMRDWLVLCAWTHRVKHQGRWMRLEDFLAEQHGYQISHGISDPSLADWRNEADAEWRNFPAPASETPLEPRQSSRDSEPQPES